MYYRAILMWKNGQQTEMATSKILQYIDVIAYPEPFKCEEFIELTPDNIIDKGGFTKLFYANTPKIRFQLYGELPGIDRLYYKET